MPSVTLSSEWKGWFSPALFKKNATRFWPLWGVYTMILFFALPMELMNLGGRMAELTPSSELALNYREQVTHLLVNNTLSSPYFGAMFGLLTAMALFSYLMNPHSCQLLHTLPIRREGLFITNWISGLCFFAVPNGVIALFSSILGAVYGFPVFPDVWLWFLIQTAACMFFFCFAMCCAMFTGNLLALPIFYGILNFLVMGLFTMADAAMDILLRGYPGAVLRDVVFSRWCTPLYQLSWLLIDGGDSGLPAQNLYSRLYSPVGAICYCISLGAIATFIAWLVYRFRQLERAGDLVTVGWVRPVFQYGFGLCFGMALGTLVYHNFFSSEHKPWMYIFQVALWAAVGAFAGRMLLKKTFRVFRDGWKGVAVFVGAVLLLLGGAWADLWGYQRWTPDPAQVEYASITGLSDSPWDRGSGGRSFDEDDISAVVDFHAALVSRLDMLDDDNWSYYGRRDSNGYDISTNTTIRLYYFMKDGSTVERYWSGVPITAEALADETTYAAKLQALLNRPGCAEWVYFNGMGDVEDLKAVGVGLSNAKEEFDKRYEPKDSSAIPAPTESKWEYSTRDGVVWLDVEAAEKLWNAVLEDMDAGNLGRRYLLEDEARYTNCYHTDLIFTLLRWYQDKGVWQSTTEEVRITIQKSAKRTLAVLEEIGCKDALQPWDPEELRS